MLILQLTLFDETEVEGEKKRRILGAAANQARAEEMTLIYIGAIQLADKVLEIISKNGLKEFDDKLKEGIDDLRQKNDWLGKMELYDA